MNRPRSGTYCPLSPGFAGERVWVRGVSGEALSAGQLLFSVSEPINPLRVFIFMPPASGPIFGAEAVGKP